MHSSTCSMFKVNGHLSEPFRMARSIRHDCLLLPLLYVFAFESLLQKLEQLRGIFFELGHERAILAYADDVTVMVLATSEVKTVGIILTDYGSVAGAKINADKSVGLWLSSSDA